MSLSTTSTKTQEFGSDAPKEQSLAKLDLDASASVAPLSKSGVPLTSSLSTTQILVNETLRNGHLYHSDRVSDLPTVLESEAKELAAHINTSDLI